MMLCWPAATLTTAVGLHSMMDGPPDMSFVDMEEHWPEPQGRRQEKSR